MIVSATGVVVALSIVESKLIALFVLAKVVPVLMVTGLLKVCVPVVVTVAALMAVGPVIFKLVSAVEVPIVSLIVTPVLPDNVKPNAPSIVLVNPSEPALLVKVVVAPRTTGLP